MKTYTYRVFKTVSLEGTITVDAKNEETAYEIAMAKSSKSDRGLNVVEDDVDLDLVYVEGLDD